MDEKAINFRIEVWFNPPIAPINVENKTIKNNKKKSIENDKIIKGAIFCHVMRIKLLIHDIPSITFGNQKWKGAIPAFIINEIDKIMFIINSVLINNILFSKQ